MDAEQPQIATGELAKELEELSVRKLNEYLNKGLQQETVIFTSRKEAWRSLSNPIIIETEPPLPDSDEDECNEPRCLVLMSTYRPSLNQTIHTVTILSGRELHFMLTCDPTLVVRLNPLNEEPRTLYQPGSDSSWFMTVATESQSLLNMEILDFYPEYSSESSSPTESSMFFNDDRVSSSMGMEPLSPVDSPMSLSGFDRDESSHNRDFCTIDVEIERPPLHRKDARGVH